MPGSPIPAPPPLWEAQRGGRHAVVQPSGWWPVIPAQPGPQRQPGTTQQPVQAAPRPERAGPPHWPTEPTRHLYVVTDSRSPEPTAVPEAVPGPQQPELDPQPALKPQPEREPDQLHHALPDLALQVVNRLFDMNLGHTRNAWLRRRRDPLSPYALAFFFHEPPSADSGDPRARLRTATRLFLAGDASTLPRLLFRMNDVLGAQLTANPDVRTVATGCDEMSRAARYVGVGVSSLDTGDGTWTDAQKTAFTDMDVPGRCYAVLADGWRLRVDRRASREYGRAAVLTTHRLPHPDVSGRINRGWSLDNAGELTQPPRELDADAWAWLATLHTTLHGAFHAV